MPLVTQLREGVHPLVFPTDLSVDKHSSTSSAAVAIACGGSSSGVGSTGLLLSSASDRKSPCLSAASLSVTVSNILAPKAAVAAIVPSSPSPPPETTTTSPLPSNNLLCETGGNATAAGPSGSCITSTIDNTPHNCSSSLASDKLASKLKQLSEDEAAVLMLKATSNEKATNNSGNLSDNSFGGGDDGVPGAGNASGDYHSALSGAGAFGDGVGNTSGLCNINILSSISAMNSLIGGGNGSIGIGIGSSGGHPCPECGRVYKLKSSLRNHQKWECGKEPQFQCPFCVYRAKQKMHIGRHMERMHKEKFLKLDDIKSYTGGGGSGSGGGAGVGAGSAGGSVEESGNTATSTTTVTAAAAAAAAAVVAAAELRQHFSS